MLFDQFDNIRGSCRGSHPRRPRFTHPPVGAFSDGAACLGSGAVAYLYPHGRSPLSLRATRVPLTTPPATLFLAVIFVCTLVGLGLAAEGDRSTHEADHDADTADLVLPEVHVHGLPLNKDQQLGPVPTYTPWPKIPTRLDGQPLDDWMKARFLVSRDATVEVVILEPAKHRELTVASLSALKQWRFDPQMHGDEPVDGEITVRIHFRTQ